MENKDYYRILGLTEEDKKLSADEFNRLVKNKFRTLSKENHPDLFAKSSESERKLHEDRFKEINEAYSVLSDENKRREYDIKQMGFGGFDPFGNGFMNNPFTSSWNNSNNVGSDIKIAIKLTLEDVLYGVTKKVSIKRKTKCLKCRKEPCKHCHGTGFVMQSSFGMNSLFQTKTQCPVCHGTGEVSVGHCDNCKGSGFINETVVETIAIPSGVEDGMLLTVPHRGNEYIGRGNGVNGDLIIKVNIMKHNTFDRIGTTLVQKLELTIEDAWIGCDAKVKTLDGTTLNVKIPALTPCGKQFRIPNKGLPYMNSTNRGDMIVSITYKMPKKELSDKQIKLLREFYEEEN